MDCHWNHFDAIRCDNVAVGDDTSVASKFTA
jgi:hypothetical protein